MARRSTRYQPGDRIGGRYQVHQVLMGGMGEVYLCLDLEQMLPLALKTFQQRYLTDPQRLRRAFESEVTTWVALEKHPNIVHCFWMQTFDNQPFMALEWIAGEEGKGADLRSWLRQGPLDLKLALQIAIDVCNGLIHAQTKQPGLVHRDLKPENILMAQGGLAKITDFGLAQIVQTAGLEVDQEGANDSRHTLVHKRGIAGTPAYMAPEQWRGYQVDERTDMYALGCILYEMLVGETPFQVIATKPLANFERWLDAIQTVHESKQVSDLPARLPTELNDLVQTCMAKEPSSRPTNLTDLLSQFIKIYSSSVGQIPIVQTKVSSFSAIDYNNRGFTYHALNRFEEALTDYNRGIELSPHNSQLYTNRGNTYFEMNRYKEAMADYNRALALDPSDAHAYSNRATLHSRLRNFQQALADHDQAIQCNPRFAKAFYNRGQTYVLMQRFEDALLNYNKAIDLDRQYVKAYGNRGKVYEELQQFEKAQADYEQAFNLDPNDITACFNLGANYARHGSWNKALPYFEHAALLGDIESKKLARYVRQKLTTNDVQEPDIAQIAFENLRRATTMNGLLVLVSEFPFVTDQDFIEAVEQTLVQQPREHRHVLAQQLAWLKQIAVQQDRKEQN